MKLFMMRHGTAEDADHVGEVQDFDRALSMRGRKRIRQMGRALRENWLLPDLIASSPLVRALQTAEILAASLDPNEPVIVRRELAPQGDIFALVKELMDSEIESALLVGHEPSLSEFVTSLLGDESWGGGFTKGMIVALRVGRDGVAKALFLMDTKRLEPIPL
ncbi:MAG: Phosphohistidine phosphatase SixA [Deltaproteobacteria bacterium ADurb.Bin207]|nr:MAG: Phosphohistidine phosphatase SixA [Deltaproteobacteria bacterium ADurb.Bin207]